MGEEFRSPSDPRRPPLPPSSRSVSEPPRYSLQPPLRVSLLLLLPLPLLLTLPFPLLAVRRSTTSLELTTRSSIRTTVTLGVFYDSFLGGLRVSSSL